MVFYAFFNSISVISRRQLTLFMLSWVSPVLGWALKCLAQGHSHEKTQRIQCGSNPRPLDYESNTLPLSHVGPYLFTNLYRLFTILIKEAFENIMEKGGNAANHNFFSFSHDVFLPFPKQILIFQSHLFFRLQVLSIWTSLKICRMVKSKHTI